MRQNYSPGDAPGKEFNTQELVAHPAPKPSATKSFKKNTFGGPHPSHRQQSPFKKYLRQASALGRFRATDLHFRDYVLDGSCGGAEALKGSFPLARPAEYFRYVLKIQYFLIPQEPWGLWRSPGDPCGGVLGTLAEESWGPLCRSLSGKRGISCCYLQQTWGVIFGWVELSAPRSVDFGDKGALRQGSHDTHDVTWPRCNSLGHRPENSCCGGRKVRRTAMSSRASEDSASSAM